MFVMVAFDGLWSSVCWEQSPMVCSRMSWTPPSCCLRRACGVIDAPFDGDVGARTRPQYTRERGTFNHRRMTAARGTSGKTPTRVLPSGGEVALNVQSHEVRMVAGEHVVDARDHDELGPRQELCEATADAERADPVGIAPHEQRGGGHRGKARREVRPFGHDPWR